MSGARGRGSLSERIQQARVEDSLRQHRIAERADFFRSGLRLGARSGISSEKFVLFTQIVGVSAEWLITGERAFEACRIWGRTFIPISLRS